MSVEAARPRIGILGGTFDPIHCGHLDVARAAKDALTLDEVWLVPARVPPHRPVQPIASAFHRFAMAALAAAETGADWLLACDIELSRNGPSYTSTTLQHLAGSGYTPSQIFFLTGADAFAEIATWHDYPAFLDQAHFVVVSRPRWSAASMREHVPALSRRMVAAGAGAVPPEPSILLVEAPTADVSSTEVRQLLASGRPLEGRVPAAVERHASRHGLYRA